MDVVIFVVKTKFQVCLAWLVIHRNDEDDDINYGAWRGGKVSHEGGKEGKRG